MPESPLYCIRCGRRYQPRAAAGGGQLHCAACGGPLAERREPGGARPGDPFRGRTVGGARLRKLLAVRPTHCVYRATHLQLRTTVRVEAFSNEFAERNAGYVAQHFRAAAATRDLRSTYVVTLLDIGRRADCWFIVLEWEPSDLRALLETGAPLPVNRALGLLEGVLAGLDAVHAAGLVHGNVTPEGILLARDGSPKLDHLAALPRAEELGRLVLSPGGCLAGPALYVAPERAVGRQGDIRSDLYSLGATAFEMLAARPPYLGRSAQEVLDGHAGESPPDLREARPDVPDEIAAFVRRLMAREPSARFADPAEALGELRRVGVDLSRRKVIGPVAGSLTEGQRLRSAVQWTAAWTLVALLLLALAAVPGVLMCREQWRREPGHPAGVPAAAGKVAVVIAGGDGAPLPADRAVAVRALLGHALASYPAFEPADAYAAEAPSEAGQAPGQAGRTPDAEYLLTASPAPGLGRRRWTLTLDRPAEAGWAVTRQCAVEEGEPDGLAPLERAAGEVLAEAAMRVQADAPAAAPAVTGASAESWAHVAAALRAERQARWQRAFEHADAAARQAPRPAPFALLAAFYGGVDGAAETGRFEPVPALARDELPPEMAALARVLDALAEGDEAGVEARFGDYLARFPRSARGYWLLGLWRLKGQGRTDEALVAFRHALDIDPDYVPAAQGCVDVLGASAAGRPPQ